MFDKSPGLVDIRWLIANYNCTQAQLPDGRWVPSRPIGLHSLTTRLYLAWMVFVGKADALVWPEQ